MKDLKVFILLSSLLVFFTSCFSFDFERDTLKKDAYYFISNRNNVEGEYTMYKAKKGSAEIAPCVIKGNFEIEGSKHMRSAEISVYNITTDELVGVYRTNSNTGNYLVILLPNVKYEFVINCYGYAPVKKIIEIPSYASTDFLEEVSTQKMLMKMSGGKVDFTLNTWIVEEKEPTILLLTVYSEKKKRTPHIELYQQEEETELTKRGRKRLKDTEFGNIDELLRSEAEAQNKKPELAKQAFEDKNYEEAVRIYGELIKLDPTDVVTNYRLGVALFHVEENKQLALPYLKSAAKSMVAPNDIHYYLGSVYHLRSDFNNAKTSFEMFKSKATKEEIDALDVVQLIANCENGSLLMKEQVDMQILRKRSADLGNFLKRYPTGLVSGRVQKKTESFLSDIDKSKKEEMLMVRMEQNDIIQSSYGNEKNKSKDLYYNIFMGGDKWGLPQSLGENINTEFDEDYVYVTPDGSTMYFSSKGHNSIGGYDIFVSKRDSSKSSWSKPKNMGYPINSPYDDILFIPHENNERAYFSSNRRTPKDKYKIYEIKMPQPPLPLSVIKGHFMTIDTIPNFMATITVYNTNNSEVAGVYNTNSNTGHFLMALIPGVKYELMVECDGFKDHSAYITLPIQTESFDLRQDLRLKKESPFEILRVDNYFTKEEVMRAPEYRLTRKDFERQQDSLAKNNIQGPIQMKENKVSSQEERKLLDQAEQYFINKQYIRAAEKYEQVVPYVELNAKHSFYYGKALYNVSRDYEKTLKYLEQAVKDKNIPYEVHYLLGKTNHRAYRFERAVKSFESYKRLASIKEVVAKDIHNEINLCRFGKRIANEPKPIEVISKKEIKKDDLHMIYNSVGLGSKFLLAPDDLVSEEDKVQKFRPTMCLNSTKTAIFFSSYGNDASRGKDIYLVRKLPDNSWTKPINIGEEINTEGDEDFPYMGTDGSTLYFCSTKHGSMGGYDIYKSKWDEASNKWSKPINMGAPINSPFDDLLFVE